jgi:hypothetical protein
MAQHPYPMPCSPKPTPDLLSEETPDGVDLTLIRWTLSLTPLERLEFLQGWADDLQGVLTGIRQFRRAQPPEVEEVDGLPVLTPAEMARIKAWLLATRFTTRDYIETILLFGLLGEGGTREALRTLDTIYPQPSGASVLAEVVDRLGSARPVDVAEIDLTSYRGLQPPWNDWEHVASRGRWWAEVLADLLLRKQEDGA